METKKLLLERAKRARYTNHVQYTRFLTPADALTAEVTAREMDVQCALEGGWENAERRMCAFFCDDPPEAYPLTTLRVRWDARFGSVKHRDLMGSLMSLGIEPDTIGDIAMGRTPGSAYIACTRDVSSYIISAFDRAGRTPLKTDETNTVSIAPPEGVNVRVTVAHVRIDAVIAAGWHLSRAEAQRLISEGLVKRNHVFEERCDKELVEGDLISARGLGRLRVDAIQGETRKGRIGLNLFRYGK